MGGEINGVHLKVAPKPRNERYGTSILYIASEKWRHFQIGCSEAAQVIEDRRIIHASFDRKYR